jgi:hypothetical protein
MACGGRAKTTASPLGVCTDCTVQSLPAYLVYHTCACDQLLEINHYSTTHAL